jgi:uncharacterized membrane protein
MVISSALLLSEPNATYGKRIQSVDFLRGVVMVLMAIDHVRVYSGIPAGGTTTAIFFTRWVTHFCVPTFVFFAGTSAFLYEKKIHDRKSLSSYLLTRGLLLVFLELTLLRFSWTFNFNYSDFMLAGVIWMIGWCMVLMSACIWLSSKVNGIIGLIIIFFQQGFRFIPGMVPQQSQKSFDWFWAFIYPIGQEGHAGIAVLYVLVPWIGVMMLGYSFGMILIAEPLKRKKLCLWIGSVSIAFFLIADVVVFLLNQEQDKLPVLFQLLNQQKYPPSQLYLLMTLGPLILLVPVAEKVKGIAEMFLMFGRVPLFYYLLHIPLIHLLALAVNFLREGSFHQDRYGYAPFTEIPQAHQWGLPLLYLVFFIAEVILYFICRAYARYKAGHPEIKWLKYL